LGCDRAWLLYPCDPESASWRVPVERTRPEYPGAMAIGIEVPMTAEAATLMHTVLSTDGPVRFDPDSEYPLAAEDAQRFGYQSQISMALHPQGGKPWMFGLHQCAYARVWTPQEERLFQEVGRRLADALTGLLAYRELRESEERYRTIFQNAPLGIFRSTFDGRFLEVNPALAKILGYDSPESVIDEIDDIAEQVYLRPEIRHKMIPQQVSSTSVVQYLDRFRRKDGSEFIANLYLKTIRDAADRPVFLEGIVEDITEREQAAGDLRKLSHAIEQSPAVIIITDIDGNIEYVNPRFTQLSGFTRDEVVGKNPRILKSGETEQSEYQRLWDTITRGGEWQGEFHNKKKTGEFYWVSVSISPVLDSQGNIKNFVGVQEDITARKQRERDLESLVTVAMALRAAPGRDEVAHIVVNQVFELLRSGGVALLLHYPQDDKLKVTAVRGTWEQWPSIQFPLGDEVSRRVIASGKPYINNDVETYMQLYQPALVDSLSAVACVPLIAENEVIGVLWVGQQSAIEAHDVQLLEAVADMAATAIRRAVLYEQTQRYAAELEARVAERTRELAKANEQLLELDQLKTKFVSDVSHELRTPITNLQLYLDLLKQGKPEKREKYIAVLKQQTNRLTRLVEDILDLSRLELSGSRAVFAPVDLNQLVRQIVTTYQPSAENANLRLTFEPGPDLPPVIGEINQLAQVVTNLVGNALNYTLHGSIRVWTHWEDDWICLDVADTGIGIDPEDMPHLFERFYRGKYVSQRNIPGTGLGLAIIKEIVDLHGGRIEAASQPGEGATFSVRLPFAA
jgi:PAS domain S-box-containing protein